MKKLLLVLLFLGNTLTAQDQPGLVTTTSGGGGASLPVVDTTSIVEGSADPTKELRFEIDGFTAGATRVLTPPNADGTIAVLGTAQSWGAVQQTVLSGGVWSFTDGAAALFGDTYLSYRSVRTPGAAGIETGAAANAVHVNEVADFAFDFNNGPCGTAACTNPQQIVHDKDQNVTDYQSHGVSGMSGKFTKTLTETVATSVVIIPVPDDVSISGQFIYTVHARDATNAQTRSGSVLYNGVAEGVTATCVLGTPTELDNTPTGTLTATVTCTSPANNQIQILINATSSLAQTTLEAYGTLIHVGAGEPLPQ